MNLPTANQWQLSALQWCSGPDPTYNVQQMEHLLAELPVAERHLVVLPECALIFAGKDGLQLQHQEALGQGKWQRQLAHYAKRYNIYLLLGSFPIQSADPSRFYACSLLFGPTGELLADYQKLHLFDALVADSTGSYQESASTKAGTKITLVSQQQLKLGMTICYDVRFPALMQQLARMGMNVLAVPSAFTKVTGQAHWHTLLRARAIENQCFVVAANQTGLHANGRETFGHSLIIDPYGRVLADAAEGEKVISVSVDLAEADRVQRAMPLLHHNRFTSELKQ